MTAYRFQHPMRFTGVYPTNWAGYVWLELLGYTSGNHPGVDYNYGAGDQDKGMDMVAIADGELTYIGDQTARGFGKTTIIKHELDTRLVKKYGTTAVYSRTMHQDNFVTGMKTGTKVKCGQKIGTVGDTGTEWAHGHIEIWRSVLGSHLEYHKDKAYIQKYYFDTFRFIEENKNNTEETVAMVTAIGLNYIYRYLLGREPKQTEINKYVGKWTFDKAAANVRGGVEYAAHVKLINKAQVDLNNHFPSEIRKV